MDNIGKYEQLALDIENKKRLQEIANIKHTQTLEEKNEIDNMIKELKEGVNKILEKIKNANK